MIDESIVMIDAKKEQNLLEKNTNYYVLLDFWLQALEQKKEVAAFFERRGYKNIAIYGMAGLGNHLQCQVENAVNILYTIDRKMITYKEKQYSMTENISILPKPDVIVVTPIMEYMAIKEELSKLINTDIVSLEEVILSL